MIKELISRRAVVVGGASGLLLTACGDSSFITGQRVDGTPTAARPVSTTAPARIDTPRPVVTETPVSVVTARPTADVRVQVVGTVTETPRAVVTANPAGGAMPTYEAQIRALQTQVSKLEGTATPVVPMVDRAGIKVHAKFPEKATNVEMAKGEFKFTLPVNEMSAFVAEPGWLLVGPDFESRSKSNPNGDNPAGWEAMWNSKGHIRPFSPDTQHSFVTEGPSYYLASEGGWALFSCPQLTLEAQGREEIKLEIPAEKGVNNLVLVRGLYPDGQQDTPRNTLVKISNYIPGATLGMRHPGGSNGENSAFWSEGQFKQVVAVSHRSDSNCGLEGCSKVRVYYVDLNTVAFGKFEHTSGRLTTYAEAVKAAGTGWTKSYTNY